MFNKTFNKFRIFIESRDQFMDVQNKMLALGYNWIEHPDGKVWECNGYSPCITVYEDTKKMYNGNNKYNFFATLTREQFDSSMDGAIEVKFKGDKLVFVGKKKFYAIHVIDPTDDNIIDPFCNLADYDQNPFQITENKELAKRVMKKLQKSWPNVTYTLVKIKV